MKKYSQPSQNDIPSKGNYINKLRAWAGDRKCMYENVGVIPYVNTFSIVPFDSVTGDKLGEMLQSSHEITIMQHIGIKDRNGNPIYEGDILTLDGSEHYQVKYIAPKYVLADEDGDMIFDSKAYFEERGIVGNIYENPNLLKQI